MNLIIAEGASSALGNASIKHMVRRDARFENGAYYHIYNRGANKSTIYSNADEYLFFLRRTKEYLNKAEVDFICYCLMPNHFHFALKQISDNGISKFLARLAQSYTQAINRKYNRTGVLFEGPFRAQQIYDEGHLLRLCRYIHSNPLAAGLVGDINQWPYSNWFEFIGKRRGSLYSDDFLKFIKKDKVNYERFVLDYLGDDLVDPEIQKYKLD